MRAHHDEALREPRELVHHARAAADSGSARIVCSVVTIGMRSSRSSVEDVAAGLAAEDPVLVLQRHDVDGVDVQEVRGAPVRGDVALGDLEAHARRVGVALPRRRSSRARSSRLRQLPRDGAREVGRERRDAALPRQVIAEHRDLLDAGGPAVGVMHVPLQLSAVLETRGRHARRLFTDADYGPQGDGSATGVPVSAPQPRRTGQYTSVRVSFAGVSGGLKNSSHMGPAETRLFSRIHASMAA